MKHTEQVIETLVEMVVARSGYTATAREIAIEAGLSATVVGRVLNAALDEDDRRVTVKDVYRGTRRMVGWTVPQHYLCELLRAQLHDTSVRSLVRAIAKETQERRVQVARRRAEAAADAHPQA